MGVDHVIAGAEHEWDAAILQQLGQGIDQPAVQIDVENRDVDRLSVADKVQGLGQRHRRSEHIPSQS